MRAWAVVILGAAMLWGGAAGAQEVSDFELRAAYCLGREMELKSFVSAPTDEDCRRQVAASAPYGPTQAQDTAKYCRANQESGRLIDATLAHLRVYLMAKGFGAPNHPGGDGDMLAVAAGQRDQKAALGGAYEGASNICQARCAAVDGVSAKTDCVHQCLPGAETTGVIARLFACDDLLKALPF